MANTRLNPSVRRGLQYWAMHCAVILDDKQVEHDRDMQEGCEPAQEVLRAWCAALDLSLEIMVTVDIDGNHKRKTG